ncbi:MAG: hypothetical protein AAB636_01845 [Patescibacteria group bacterium]
MKIITVIPFQKGGQKEELTYFSSKDIKNGSVVSITLRNKKILGITISSMDASEAKSSIKDLSFNLKKIIGVKENFIWKNEFIETIILSSLYFVKNKSDSFASLIPVILKEKYDEISKFSNKIKENKNNSKNIRSEKLLFQAPEIERISFYKTFIRESFAKNKSVFMVLPTQNDVRNFEELLNKGIEQFTISIHGGLSPKKQINIIEKIMTENHPLLILGTAPFLSIKRNDLGTIILEHENSNAYRMMSKPYFDLRTFIEIFASKINAKLILSDTLLRFETIARQEIDSLSGIQTLNFRIKFEGNIEIENSKKSLIDKKLISIPKFKIFSEKTINQIKNNIKNGQNVFIFSLKKGLASCTICKDCSTLINCEKCLSPMTLYSSKDNKKRIFICNHCRTNKESEISCEYCGSWNLMPLGIGIDSIYEEIQEVFKKDKINILRLDKSIAKNHTECLKIINEFYTGNKTSINEGKIGKILIGTELAFSYLKEKVHTSIVASFDTLWYIPDFKISEKIIQIIISIISKTKDKLIIQTKKEDDQILLAIKNGNLLSTIRNELDERKSLGYPPFLRFIKITHLGNKIESIKARELLEEIFKEYNPIIFSGFHTKTKGQYTTNALIKIKNEKWSIPPLTISGSIDEKLSLKLLSISSISSPFEIFVDPENLL